MTYDLLAPVWRVLTAGLRGVVLTIFFLAAGCGERTAENPSSGADGGRTEPNSVPPPAVEGVFFPEVRQVDAIPSAQGAGKLVLDDRGCLRMCSTARTRRTAGCRCGPLPQAQDRRRRSSADR